MRQIVLDTETTGLDPQQGHRIIEIGGVELIDRRPTGNDFHRYLQPDRAIDSGAAAVHGLTDAFLADKPRFADLAATLLDYLAGAELIIHNAAFDLGFLDREFGRWRAGMPPLAERHSVIDTLLLARRLHPGQRNSLDALCKRYGVDNSRRDLHGALLDAGILAEVYLAMTGGQTALHLGSDRVEDRGSGRSAWPRGRIDPARPRLRVARADANELAAHQARLEAIARAAGEIGCRWPRAAGAASVSVH